MVAPVFVVPPDCLDVGTVVVDGAEGHHAATVTRLAVGEPVVLTDGAGRRAGGVVESTSRGTLAVRVDRVEQVPAQQPRLVVVQALPKGDRGELAVSMLTEVGADVVVPWAAARAVTQWRGDRGAKALQRWRSAARAAAKQARRAWFPEVTEIVDTAQVVALLSRARGVVLHESALEPLAGLDVPHEGEVVVVVGPEGGLTDDELDAFTAVGATAYRLGDTVLRTSTAGVAALSVLQAGSNWRRRSDA